MTFSLHVNDLTVILGAGWDDDGVDCCKCESSEYFERDLERFPAVFEVKIKSNRYFG